MTKGKLNLLLRILIDLALFFAVFTMPFFVTAIIAIFAMIYFYKFYEFIFFFFLIDLLYGSPNFPFHGIPFFLTISASIIFIVTSFLKRKIFYINNYDSLD